MKDCVVPIDNQEFNKNKNKKDGLNNICKICSRNRSRKYYQLNAIAHKNNIMRQNKKYKNIILQSLCMYLLDNECKDCKNKDIRVLEFDHLRDKKFNISKMVSRSYSWNTILIEINKCDIICRNCHAIRTAKRANYYKHTFWTQSLLGKAPDF